VRQLAHVVRLRAGALEAVPVCNELTTGGAGTQNAYSEARVPFQSVRECGARLRTGGWSSGVQGHYASGWNGTLAFDMTNPVETRRVVRRSEITGFPDILQSLLESRALYWPLLLRGSPRSARIAGRAVVEQPRAVSEPDGPGIHNIEAVLGRPAAHDNRGA